MFQKYGHRIRRLRLIASILRRPGRLLDVGCSDCLLQMYLASNIEYFGVDVGKIKAGPYAAHLVVADAQELPFKDQSFDYVVCTEVVEHLRNAFAAILEAYRVLKQEGKAVISTPNRETLTHAGKYLEDPTHLRLLSCTEIRQMMLDCGYGDIRRIGYDMILDKPFLAVRFIPYLLRRKLAQAFLRLEKILVVIGERPPQST